MADEAAPQPVDATPMLIAEYGLLAGALATAWSASLTRTSLFLGVLSAAGIALGFAAQGGVGRGEFVLLSLVVLPLVLFLGVTTFIRLVELQREAAVYLTGQNRIRRFFVEQAPESRPYWILPVHDDEASLSRSPGTGMHRTPPGSRLSFLLAQTQGIVGVVTGVVAAAIVGLAVVPFGTVPALALSIAAFVATTLLLLRYWLRSLAELRAAIRPISPTPPDELDAPF